MSGADALVRRIVWCPHVFADLRGQAATELVLFVHDFMCSGAEQLPMPYMVAAAGHYERIRSQIADQMNQVPCGGVVWHGHDEHASLIDAGMLEYLPLGCVAEMGFQSVSLCNVDVVRVEIDRHHLLLVRVHQTFRNPLSSRDKTNDHD